MRRNAAPQQHYLAHHKQAHELVGNNVPTRDKSKALVKQACSKFAAVSSPILPVSKSLKPERDSSEGVPSNSPRLQKSAILKPSEVVPSNKSVVEPERNAKDKLPEDMIYRKGGLQSRYEMMPNVTSSSSSAFIHFVKSRASSKTFAAKCVNILRIADSKPNVVIRVRGMIPRTAEEVMREALTMWMLQDVPSVVNLVEVLVEPGEQRIVLLMEHLKGETVPELLLKNKGALRESEVQTLASAIVRAFDELHAKGLAHNDFSLKHLVLKDPGDLRSVKLVDFAPPKPSESFSRARPGADSSPFHPPEVAVEELADLDAREGNLWDFGVFLLTLLPGGDEEMVSAMKSPPYLDPKSALFPRPQTARGGPKASILWYETVQKWTDEVLGRSLQKMRTHGLRKEACDLIEKCLVADPKLRFTAKQARQHPWFACKFLLPSAR
mmetsp:Transcript_26683/g.44735  ORF Transcript_26683/g.44735 Transcript_26683/m.44735 type:complete len:439 (-) Transcript_26683:301-1617(-)|eukprot:CAMPEP_0198199698 /NCGR_PEP_ID=MMETSP1445-20131203/2901_1 /TAXON_ID=36898 /ORGANISM="Pyramimonas sp., Strain CCMP2087" /LENGTH=438 /DNA_ID=CAMNT_0043869587 /DNA_START=297 /DNA_END=1613 /DNA_ORIENTATION=+